MAAPYTSDKWWFSREWDAVIVSGSMHYNDSGQQNHATAKETVPAGWRPYGHDRTAIAYGAVSAVNANWCNFIRPDGTIIMLGNTEGVYSGVTGGWQCREWRN